MGSKEILDLACSKMTHLIGTQMNVLTVEAPSSNEYTKFLSTTISKLSPLIGNMLEYKLIETLNQLEWENGGNWVRQDPGFPDAIFNGQIEPKPGIEIKCWFPFATEMTARFKESVNRLKDEEIKVVVIAWLLSDIYSGKPIIIDLWIGDASDLATRRNDHYHNPPSYIVIEPEDTTSRTRNLQQTNCSGYKFQGSDSDYRKALGLVSSWGSQGTLFSPDKEYQKRLKDLSNRFKYRLDTNFAKIDRIQHNDLELFKQRVLSTKYKDKTIAEWTKEFLGKVDNLNEQE